VPISLVITIFISIPIILVIKPPTINIKVDLINLFFIKSLIKIYVKKLNNILKDKKLFYNKYIGGQYGYRI
jgi:lipid A disaccharide synthetase